MSPLDLPTPPNHEENTEAEDSLEQLRAQMLAQGERRRRKLADHKRTTERAVAQVERATTFMSKSKMKRYLDRIDGSKARIEESAAGAEGMEKAERALSEQDI